MVEAGLRACFDLLFTTSEYISMEAVRTEAEQQEKHTGIKEKTTDLADHIEDLATTYYKLGLLKVTQKATVITSHLLTVIAACVFGFFVVLFAGLGLSWWLGNLLENRVAGFLLGAAFFLLVLVVLIMLRKQIVFPLFRNLIIKEIYEDKD
jgi:hypothetical protein